MRLPRNIGGAELASLLSRFGYAVTRQTGSHLRLTTSQFGEHHLTIPNHDSLKTGTLNGILNDVAGHLGLAKEKLLRELFKWLRPMFPPFLFRGARSAPGRTWADSAPVSLVPTWFLDDLVARITHSTSRRAADAGSTTLTSRPSSVILVTFPRSRRCCRSPIRRIEMGAGFTWREYRRHLFNPANHRCRVILGNHDFTSSGHGPRPSAIILIPSQNPCR